MKLVNKGPRPVAVQRPGGFDRVDPGDVFEISGDVSSYLRAGCVVMPEDEKFKEVEIEVGNPKATSEEGQEAPNPPINPGKTK